MHLIFIFTLRKIPLIGYLDTRINIKNFYGTMYGQKHNCERSELSGLFNGTDFLIIYIYYYICVCVCVYSLGRTSCHKCFHVILNIHSIRLALLCNTTHVFIACGKSLLVSRNNMLVRTTCRNNSIGLSTDRKFLQANSFYLQLKFD